MLVSYDQKCAFGPTFEPIVMLIYVIQPIVPKCEIMWEAEPWSFVLNYNNYTKYND